MLLTAANDGVSSNSFHWISKVFPVAAVLALFAPKYVYIVCCLLFPTEHQGVARIQKSWERVLGRCLKEGQPKPSQIWPSLMWKRAAVGTRQQRMKHEQKVLSTRSGRDATESASNRVRTLYTYIKNPLHLSFLTLCYVMSHGYVIVVFLPGE
jgi:hypothetical protein